jgi:hypothetical protein
MNPARRVVVLGAALILLSTALALVVPTAKHIPEPALADSKVSRVADRPTPVKLIAHGSWCWFGDPRAIQVGGPRGPTFVGWIDWRGRITVGAYDPRRQRMRSHVIGRLAVDDHGSPSLLIEPDKRLTVFWSGHGGPTMNYRTTLRPLDISAWGALHHLHSQLRGPKGYTYPNPILLPAERDKLYLFWRGGDWSQDFATRTGEGRWSSAHRLISVPGERPYVKVAPGGPGTIAFAFTNGHPRGVLTSVYYAAYRAGALWTAAGRRIAAVDSRPIAPSQADLVYDARATGAPAWVWDVAVAGNGRPVVVYATFPTKRRHVYWYASWDGSRWVSHRMTEAGPSISPRTIEQEYSGGIALDHRDPSIVYLARKVGRWFEIERWVTPDGGATWRYQTVVRTPGQNNVRPIVPRGSNGGPMGLLWLHGAYRGYTKYRTWIAYER